MTQAKQTVNDSLTLPDDDTLRLRARLILEEVLETINAMGFQLYVGSTRIKKKHLNLIEHSTADLKEILDGLADISVVTTGSMISCGVPDIPLLDLVDQNNLDKFGPGHSFREDGKLVKPPDHKPPNFDDFIKKYTKADS